MTQQRPQPKPSTMTFETGLRWLKGTARGHIGEDNADQLTESVRQGNPAWHLVPPEAENPIAHRELRGAINKVMQLKTPATNEPASTPKPSRPHQPRTSQPPATATAALTAGRCPNCGAPTTGGGRCQGCREFDQNVQQLVATPDDQAARDANAALYQQVEERRALHGWRP